MRLLMASILITIAVLYGAIHAAHAEVEMVPESRHQLFQTYAFLTDPQNDLLWRSGNRGWGEVGGDLPLIDLKNWRWNPQILAFASANAGYYISANDLTLKTQTIDARVGFLLDLMLTDSTRLEVGVKHESGHISDDVPDTSLIGPNLGNEIALIRVFHDIDGRIRLGATLEPVITSAPRLKTFGADQFAEWFPWGEAGPHSASYYLALSIEETGVDHIIPTLQTQVGIQWGSHFSQPHKMGLRTAIGYYNGIDPRLKYAQFMSSTLQFVYAGVLFDF